MGEGLTEFPESYTVFDRIRERQGIAAVLRGDECFGYSRWTTVHDDLSMFRALDLRALHYMPDMAGLLHPTTYRQFCEMDAETRRQLTARCSARRLHNRKDFFYLNARVKYYLNPLNYVKTFALESPRPLLDDDMLEFVTRLPLRYRMGKRFWRATVVQLFPQLYTEIAQHHNMILWPTALRAPSGQEFVRASLLAQPSILDEWVERPALQSRVEQFLAPRPTGTAQTLWLTRLERYPRLYAPVHAGNYQLKKWRGRVEHTLEPERIILRLLILKGWTDMVLEKPV
jgi:asparagine synthetase B (glutamine-hydrolysing)